MPLAQSIGLDTLSKYFHLPINDVAKELGVCATVLKKICRKNGIPRWPHRKIKSLDKMIVTLEASVAKNTEDEDRIKQEVQTLKNKRLFLMKNPNVLAASKMPPSKKMKLHHDEPDSPPLMAPPPPHHPYHHPMGVVYPSYPPPHHPYHMDAAAAMHMHQGLNVMVAAMYSQGMQPPFVPVPHMTPEQHYSMSAQMAAAAAAAAAAGQHPYAMPYPAFPLSPSAASSSLAEPEKRWEPAVDRSAFQLPATPRSGRSSSPPSEQAILREEIMHARVVPTSPLTRQHAKPSSVQQVLSANLSAQGDYNIQLPELRIPVFANEKPRSPHKIATLEPDLLYHQQQHDVPSSPSYVPSSSQQQSQQHASMSSPSHSRSPSPSASSPNWQWIKTEKQAGGKHAKELRSSGSPTHIPGSPAPSSPQHVASPVLDL